jgi:uroporphyrinogen decarboxylase
VLQALAHKRTDRAPADYGAQQGVTDRLIQKLGVADVDELLAALHVDFRRVGFGSWQADRGPDAEGYMRSMWGIRYLAKETGDGRPYLILPFTEESTVDDVHGLQWPDPDALDYSQVRAQCEKYHGEYATVGGPWSPFFHEVRDLVGQETFFIWMHTKPEVLQAIIDHFVDYEVEVTRRFLRAADGLLDITYFGNDFGTQRGLFISPEMWQTFIRKPLKRFFDVSHEFGCKVMKHSCGAIRDVIPSLIEDGVDVLDPVQVRAAGMDLPGLVRDFGAKLCFHGGVDTQRTLPFGTCQDVRNEVRSYLNLTRDNGGYILCGSQEFIEDIPLENILALYDENQRSG